METIIVDIADEIREAAKVSPRIAHYLSLREMSGGDWMERHGSGTLRKNKRYGMRIVSHYRVERVAWEFGYPFEVMPTTWVNFNDAISAGDCHAVTESGWHGGRMIERSIFPNDVFQIKHIIVDGSAGKGGPTGRREGLGILVRQTSAAWVPRGNIVFAMMSLHNKETGEWSDVRNPF
tara:strand:+ start:28 stop:561 length:534 start_codon:yes stop_codon:yes gene_type:complete